MQINLRKYFLFHLVIVIAICVALYMLFFVALRHITAHGKEVTMPGITGERLNTAIARLDSLHFTVSVDSTYDPSQKPLTVLKQLPDSGAMVKDGRIVMLTVNMLVPPQIPMPNLIGLYYNSAVMFLRNSKLVLGDTTRKPDVNAGGVLDQLYNGRQVAPGDMIAQGSRISLVIGDGIGNTKHDMPNLIQISVDDARAILSPYHVQIKITLKDPTQTITDTNAANVFDQIPKERDETGNLNIFHDGDIITLIID